MAFLSLGFLICVLMTLQMSYAAINPDKYYKDGGTGLRRLDLNPNMLNKEELEELKYIITYKEGHEQYCKFRAVRPNVPFFHTMGVYNWCWKTGPKGQKHYGSTCCKGEGTCRCTYKGSYDCFCE